MTFNIPTENPLTGEKTSNVTLVVEDRVLAAVDAARKADGTFDEDLYCLKLTGFTKGQLDAQFSKVQNKDHWKNPINTVVPNTELLLTISAIEHFHGVSNVKTEIVEVKPDVVMVRVTSDGYSC